MWSHICQGLVVVWLLAMLLQGLTRAYAGRKAEEPGGFPGYVSAFLALVIWGFVLWKAGAFTTIAGGGP